MKVNRSYLAYTAVRTLTIEWTEKMITVQCRIRLAACAE